MSIGYPWISEAKEKNGAGQEITQHGKELQGILP